MVPSKLSPGPQNMKSGPDELGPAKNESNSGTDNLSSDENFVREHKI
jgi:hypothetical protein